MGGAARYAVAVGQAVGLLLAAFVAAGCAILQPIPRGDASGRPNIVFVLADDLDRETLEHLPRLRALLADEGTTFTNAFVNVALCCPSRATILRGQYAHGTKIFTNQPPDGGFERFHELGLEASTVATWLQEAGYHTALFGKYLNGYPSGAMRTFVPPGWDEWASPSAGGPYSEFDYELNESGTLVRHGHAADDYLTDVLARKATDLIRRTAGGPSRQPLFLYLAPYAPHSPATPAPRHTSAFVEARAPRTTAFDEQDVSDKPGWVRALPPLADRETQVIDDLYRKRLQSMLAVEDLLQSLLDALRDAGELERTYLFFFSDNGFHLGQHRLMPGKQTAYEEDVRVPLVIRGPGVPAGVVREHLVINTDLAPTWAELAGARPASFVDGRSIVPLLREDPPAVDRWRHAVLLEHGMPPRRRVAPQRSPAPQRSGAPSGTLEPNDPDRASPAQGIPSYSGIRTERYVFIEYADGERELYDLRTDPDELDNVALSADPALIKRLSDWLAALRSCREATCRSAEDR